MLKENLADVEAKIVKACENSGRQRDDVTLIGKLLNFIFTKHANAEIISLF